MLMICQRFVLFFFFLAKRESERFNVSLFKEVVMEDYKWTSENSSQINVLFNTLDLLPSKDMWLHFYRLPSQPALV